MRLKPLRGQTFKMLDGRSFQFLEKLDGIYRGCSKVILEGRVTEINTDNIELPIIDTKDYEKIPNEKYRGD